jgi:type III pantothenate kinase
VATGGLAILFNEHSDMFDAVAPDLTIQGLAMLYSRTTSTP